MNLQSCRRLSFRIHKEINKGEQCVTLEIYLKIDCIDKREATTSGSKNYVRIAGKCLTTALNIRTKRRPNEKQEARTEITDITTQHLSKLLKKFNNLPQLCYNEKHIQMNQLKINSS